VTITDDVTYKIGQTEMSERVNLFPRLIERHVMKHGKVEAYLPTGASGSVVVEALCYKPKGRGFETR
jgi:hypothetical protein